MFTTERQMGLNGYAQGTSGQSSYTSLPHRSHLSTAFWMCLGSHSSPDITVSLGKPFQSHQEEGKQEQIEKDWVNNGSMVLRLISQDIVSDGEIGWMGQD
ncbi:hypothetical protein JTB14_038032 [Gonioctena quinquepunctata]|nr:hypothetical protein JTB14_038032 [Gonioctena quinquepunctata]